MIINVARSLLATIVLFASVAARAEPPAPGPGAATAPAPSAAQPLQPPAPPPKETPPPPATQAPPPPHAQPIEPPAAATAPRPPAPTAPPPAGQWVYTRQYGWLWMPYEQAYTYVVPDAATAYMFVYYPAFGWRWVVAPWVLGFGVAPYWGALGPVHFVWYARPWFRVGVPYYPYRGPGWAHPPVAGRPFRAPPHRR